MTVSPDNRANQKQRTRAAIVDAAISLLRGGVRPTVAEAAAVAKVSRATAYRYFPTQESLMVEAAAIGPVDTIERLLEELPGSDAHSRVLVLQAAFNDLVTTEENAMRLALRAYLDNWFAAREQGESTPDIREGRRIRWIATALGAARVDLTPKDRRRLEAALALTMGIEPLVVLKDVCRMQADEARSVLRWAAATLLDAALPAKGAD